LATILNSRRRRLSYNEVMQYKTIVMLIAGILFCLGSAGYVVFKSILRSKDRNRIGEYNEMFEVDNPYFLKYQRWIRICFTVVIISMLLLFVCIAI